MLGKRPSTRWTLAHAIFAAFLLGSGAWAATHETVIHTFIGD